MGPLRELCKGMVLALEADRGCCSDLADNLYAGTGLADTEALSGENLLVAHSMELSESLTEFELVTVDAEGPVSPFLALYGIRRSSSHGRYSP